MKITYIEHSGYVAEDTREKIEIAMRATTIPIILTGRFLAGQRNMRIFATSSRTILKRKVPRADVPI